MEGYVYFLKSAESDLIKIGCTQGRVSRRKREIQRMSPVELHTLGILKTQNYKSLEKELHGIFGRWRVYGEWFRLGSERTATLKACFRKKDEVVFDYETFKKYWKWQSAEMPFDKMELKFPGMNLRKRFRRYTKSYG